MKPLMDGIAKAEGVHSGAFGLIFSFYVLNGVIPLSCSHNPKHVRSYLRDSQQNLSAKLQTVLSNFHTLYRWSLPCNPPAAQEDVFGIHAGLMRPLCRKHKLEYIWGEADLNHPLSDSDSDDPDRYPRRARECQWHGVDRIRGFTDFEIEDEDEDEDDDDESRK